jgi:hypothetical protein
MSMLFKFIHRNTQLVPVMSQINPIQNIILDTVFLSLHVPYVSAAILPLKFSLFQFSNHFCPLTQSFRPHYGPGVDSTSNRNEYREYFLRGKGGRCVGLTTLPPSCADCLEILAASTSLNPQGLSGPVMGLFYPLHHRYSRWKEHKKLPLFILVLLQVLSSGDDGSDRTKCSGLILIGVT